MGDEKIDLIYYFEHFEEGKKYKNKIIQEIINNLDLINNREGSSYYEEIRDYHRQIDEKLKEREDKINYKGVYIDFPTSKMFFPLKPTSVYGDQEVPASIRVTGFVTPDVYKEISDHVEISYFLDKRYFLKEKNNAFIKKIGYDNVGAIADKHLEKEEDRFIKDFKYTKIEINSPAKNYKQDLWISEKSPFKPNLSYFIYKHKYIVYLIISAVLSCATGFLCGLIIFRKPLKYGLISLLNIFTVYPLVVYVFFSNTSGQNDKSNLNLSKKDVFLYKTKNFLLLTSVFIVIFLVFYLIMVLIYYGANDLIDIKDHVFFYSIFLFLILAGVVILLIKRRLKIQKQEFFQLLEERSISKWSLQPKDVRKLIFIGLFSIIYVFLNYLTIKGLILIY